MAAAAAAAAVTTTVSVGGKRKLDDGARSDGEGKDHKLPRTRQLCTCIAHGRPSPGEVEAKAHPVDMTCVQFCADEVGADNPLLVDFLETEPLENISKEQLGALFKGIRTPRSFLNALMPRIPADGSWVDLIEMLSGKAYWYHTAERIVFQHIAYQAGLAGTLYPVLVPKLGFPLCEIVIDLLIPKRRAQIPEFREGPMEHEPDYDDEAPSPRYSLPPSPQPDPEPSYSPVSP